MVSQLTQNLRTKDDLLILKEELTQLKNALYQRGNKYEEVLTNDTRKWVSETITKETINADKGDYLKNAEEDLKKVIVVSAAISQEPSDVLTETISSWFKKNISPYAVAELTHNPQLIGGIILSYKGKYLDLSVRKKVAAELEKISLKK